MPKTRKPASSLNVPPGSDSAGQKSKHKRVFDHLMASIQTGALKPGDRLPSEAELGKLFDASRITVAKAVHDLQRRGLVTRRPGAGTHVLAEAQPTGRIFGLLIPELALTETFEPICNGMMRTRLAHPDVLLWGNASATIQDSAKVAEETVQSFISQKVDGVFFAPLELAEEKGTVNRRIARALKGAEIPFVLLDHCYLPFPDRSAHDLVGIDNRRAGYIATKHLIEQSATRLVFVSEDCAADTVRARVGGFYEALRGRELLAARDLVWRGDPQDEEFVRRMLADATPEGIVCANDLTAARLMQTLLGLGVRIPEDVRIVGMGDQRYASLLPVPLTTVHEDFAGIAAAAIATMQERLQRPELPVRDVLIPVRLVVRRSCGAHPDPEKQAANQSGQTGI